MEIEVFKTGCHVDNKGRQRNWTVGDLDNAVARYNPAFHEAPVVVGHPKYNAPAYGWVEGLMRKGDKLFASLKQLDPGFVQAVKDGRFKKRSAAFYPDGSLRHIGFLGAMPPAVKGLADVAFAEPSAYEVEFSEPEMRMLGGLFQRLRDFLVEKFGVETADRVVNSFDVDALRQSGSEDPGLAVPASGYSEPQGKEEMDKLKELQDALAAEQTKSAEFAEKATKAEEENKTLRADKEKAATDARKAEYAAFCEDLVKAGKVTPAQKPFVVGVMELLSPVTEYEFSEGNKTAPLVEFKTFMTGLPKVVNFTEVATKTAAGTPEGETPAEFAEADPERLALHNKIVALAKAKGIPYAAACAEVSKSGGK